MDDIVQKREKIAENLSEFSIWRSVVQNVVQMDNTTLDEKISILFQAIPDFGIILSQLSLCKSLKLLGEDEYFEFINASLLRIVDDKLTIDFNPLFMNNPYT